MIDIPFPCVMMVAVMCGAGTRRDDHLCPEIAIRRR